MHRINDLFCQDMSHALDIQEDLLVRETWDPDRLRAFAADQLDALVHYAIDNSHFYRTSYAPIAARGNILATSLPTTTRDDLNRRYIDAVTNPALASVAGADLTEIPTKPRYIGDYLFLASSGSSGERFYFPYDLRERSTILAAALRRLRMSGVLRPMRGRTKVAWLYSTNPIHGTYWIGECLKQHPQLDVLTPESRTPDGVLEEVLGFGPDVLVGFPSRLTELAEMCLIREARIQVEGVGASGELLTDGARAKIRAAWGAAPRSLYGMTEGVFGSECSTRGQMHYFSDLGLIEPPTRGGKSIRISNLYARSLPLIRFAVSDYATVEKSQCTCGSPFPTLDLLRARLSETLALVDGNGAFHSVSRFPVLGVLDGQPGVRRYGVGANGGILHVKIDVSHTGHEDIRTACHRRLTEVLESLGVSSPAIHIVVRNAEDPASGPIEKDLHRDDS